MREAIVQDISNGELLIFDDGEKYVDAKYLHTHNCRHGDLILYDDEAIKVIEKSNETSPYVDIRCVVDTDFIVRNNFEGKPLITITGLEDYDASDNHVAVGDTVMLRFNPIDREITYLYTETHFEVERTKYKTDWTFDLQSRSIGIIGGDTFFAAWRPFIEENNGIPNFLDNGNQKLRGLTQQVKKTIDTSDIVLICQNMINHATAIKSRQYAKVHNVPCESFVGFSANQIFKMIDIIDTRHSNDLD